KDASPSVKVFGESRTSVGWSCAEVAARDNIIIKIMTAVSKPFALCVKAWMPDAILKDASPPSQAPRRRGRENRNATASPIAHRRSSVGDQPFSIRRGCVALRRYARQGHKPPPAID